MIINNTNNVYIDRNGCYGTSFQMGVGDIHFMKMGIVFATLLIRVKVKCRVSDGQFLF